MSHDTQATLEAQRKVLEDYQTPKIGSLYRHYKGTIYRVNGIVWREVTEEPVVIYSEAENNVLLFPWERPLWQWNEMVEHEGRSVKRFSPLDNRPGLWKNASDVMDKAAELCHLSKDATGKMATILDSMSKLAYNTALELLAELPGDQVELFRQHQYRNRHAKSHQDLVLPENKVEDV